MSAFRDEKLTEALRELAARFLQEASNGTSLITVTRCVMSGNGKYATLFLTALPADKEPVALEFAKRQIPEFREFVKKNIRTRSLPFLDFQIDLGEKNRERIDALSRE